MEQQVQLIFVRDFLDEQCVAMRDNTLAVTERDQGKSRPGNDDDYFFYLSTSIKDTGNLENLPGWQTLPGGIGLKRFGITAPRLFFIKQIRNAFPGIKIIC